MRIISLVGPTGVGKSALALQAADQLLAEQLASGVHLISADSRQVYQGMAVLTGADVPDEMVLVDADESLPFAYYAFSAKQVYLHGVTIIPPTREWSLVHFQKLVLSVIAQAEKRHEAVLLVGGTGLYQTHLFNSGLLDQAPPLVQIRQKAETLSVSQLQAWLVELDVTAFASLNESDRSNPRRLVRAIERVTWQKTAASAAAANQLDAVTHPEQVFIGIQTDADDLAERIRQRVIARLKTGALDEVNRLAAQLEEAGLPAAKLPATSACGWKELIAYARGDIEREDCIEHWTHRELAYAKRQQTWWKKYPQVQWYAVSEQDWQEKVLTAISAVFTPHRA